MKPFLLVNSGSGGGHTQSAIVATAQQLGVDHHVVQPGDNFADIVDAAIAAGADVLAAAGGDGTLCTVADIAMAHELPMIVVPAGTRNHFALDVGLSLDDPATVLRQSLGSGHEFRVDVGAVNGTTFLNNASLGLYPIAVSQSGYRKHKVKSFVNAATEAVRSDKGGTARLTTEVPGVGIVDLAPGSSCVMVVNNAYAPTFAPGARLRPRLTAGEVWMYAAGGLDLDGRPLEVAAHSLEALIKKQAIRAVSGADHITIDSDVTDVPIAVDGEVRPDLTAPFHFQSRHAALRLLVPTDPAPTTLQVSLSW